ncbi:hypothetical protein [Shimia sp. R9_1]|nr:hypothetical protein [Shimia sp. R9_1]
MATSKPESQHPSQNAQQPESSASAAKPAPNADAKFTDWAMI